MLSKSLLGTDVISCWLDTGLVSEEAQKRINEITSALPAAFTLGVIECRMDGENAQVDFLAGITLGGCEDFGILEALQGGESYGALFDNHEFLQSWGEGYFQKSIPLVWFEYDLPVEQQKLREPLIGVGLWPSHFDVRLTNPPASSIRETAHIALNRLAKSDLDEALFEVLEKCISELTPPGLPSYVASLQPRGLSNLRLVVELFPPSLSQWLEKIGHPGLGNRSSIIEEMTSCWDRIGVQVELSTEGVGDYLAIELYPRNKLSQVQEKCIESISKHTTAKANLLSSSLAWQGAGSYEQLDSPLRIQRTTVLKLIPSKRNIEVKSYLCYGVQYDK